MPTKPSPHKKRHYVGRTPAEVGNIKNRMAKFFRNPYRRLDDMDDISIDSYSLYHKHTNSRVLGVAHMDSVDQGNGVHVVADRIYYPQVDNKVGMFTILELLPSLGIETDVIITDGEESMQSTAYFFRPEEDSYNWMFSFDRSGDDVVMYQYESSAMRNLVQSCGMRVGRGSYSDISDLGHLGCFGMNVGCGMHDYHGPYGYVDLMQYLNQVDLFIEFYMIHFDSKFTHVHDEKEGRDTLFRVSYSCAIEDFCVSCGDIFDERDLRSTHDGFMCTDCLNYLVSQEGYARWHYT